MGVVKIIVNIALLVIIGFLINYLVNDIKGPILFDTESKERRAEAANNLKEIRAAQLLFKKVHGKYCGDIDSLTNFILEDSLLVVNQIGDENDSTVVVQKVESYIKILDTLYNGNVKDAKLMAYVPPLNNKKFKAKSGTIEKNKVMVDVFEVSTPYGVVFNGLNKKYFDPKEEIKVGSLTEATTAGNWE